MPLWAQLLSLIHTWTRVGHGYLGEWNRDKKLKIDFQNIFFTFVEIIFRVVCHTKGGRSRMKFRPRRRRCSGAFGLVILFEADAPHDFLVGGPGERRHQGSPEAARSHASKEAGQAVRREHLECCRVHGRITSGVELHLGLDHVRWMRDQAGQDAGHDAAAEVNGAGLKANTVAFYIVEWYVLLELCVEHEI